MPDPFDNRLPYEKLTYELATHLLGHMPQIIKRLQADVAFFLPEKTDCWLGRLYYYYICLSHKEVTICQKFIEAFYQRVIRDNANTAVPVKNGLPVMEGMMHSNMYHLQRRTDDEIELEYAIYEQRVVDMCGFILPNYQSLTMVWRYPPNCMKDSTFHVIFQGA